MVRKSIRGVLVKENDFDEVEGDPDAEEPCVTKRVVCKKRSPLPYEKTVEKKRNYIQNDVPTSGEQI